MAADRNTSYLESGEQMQFVCPFFYIPPFDNMVLRYFDAEKLDFYPILTRVILTQLHFEI